MLFRSNHEGTFASQIPERFSTVHVFSPCTLAEVHRNHVNRWIYFGMQGNYTLSLIRHLCLGTLLRVRPGLRQFVVMLARPNGSPANHENHSESVTCAARHSGMSDSARYISAIPRPFSEHQCLSTLSTESAQTNTRAREHLTLQQILVTRLDLCQL